MLRVPGVSCAGPLRHTAGLPAYLIRPHERNCPRPFDAVWPKRLPRQLVLPETSLWVNLEVSARRYPDNAAYLFIGQPLSFSALQALAAGHRPGPHTAVPDDLALLPYTSGTTGLPKGCMHSHRTLMHNVMGGAVWGHGGPEAVGLGVVPMFHITGFIYGALGSVAAGSTTVILPRWDRELAGRLIARHQVSHWTCIPTMIIDLFGRPNYASFDLSSLRFDSGGGAKVPRIVEFADALPKSGSGKVMWRLLQEKEPAPT